MKKHNEGIFIRLSLVFNSENKNFFLMNSFYIVKNMEIFQIIFHQKLSTRSKNLFLQEGLYSQVVMIKRQNEVNTNK